MPANNAALYGLGALILGIVALAVGDFALQWQPVPEHIPMRVPLAYLNAAILIAAGSAILSGKSPRLIVLCLAAFYALWVALLHLPLVAANPSQLFVWNGTAEILAMTAGGFAGWSLSDPDASRGLRVAHVARVAFGVCLLVFGSSHFVYDDFSATMIPRWLPAPLFWVYVTGCGHLAAGLSFVSGVATRLAATLLVAMLGCFVLLLHLPRVVATPAVRIEWTMLGIAISITGAAWLMRASILRASSTTA